MSAAAADAYIQQLRRFADGVSKCAQVGKHPFVVALDRGCNLDHALRDFELDVELRMPLLRDEQQVGGGSGQVAVAPVDKLELQLNTDREWLRYLEIEYVAHGSRRVVGSPAHRNATSVSTGPRIAVMSTTAAPISAACFSPGCVARPAVSTARLERGVSATPTMAPFNGLSAEGTASNAFAATLASARAATTAAAIAATIQELSHASEAPRTMK